MKTELPDYSPYGFLIADDKSFIRGLIQSMLLKCGARNIKHASSGEEAMGLLATRSSEIDCAICDWNMEPINGLELLKFVRSGSVPHTRPELPLIMLTGHADAAVVKCALALDVHGYLVKPVAMEKLIKAVDTALARQFTAKLAEHYLSIPLATLPSAFEGMSKEAAPWIFWPRNREKRQELARRVGQIRKEVMEQLKSRTQAGDKRRLVNPRKLRIAEVPIGSILASDLLTPDGTVLLAAGVTLTETLLARLREIAEHKDAEDILTVAELAPG
jgi:two-component system chemotaxis response regulator CheY